MEFARKYGCSMCGIVSSAMHGPVHSFGSPAMQPRGSSKQPEILWKDDNFTVFREKIHPISSKGHVVVAFNLHVPSLYLLSASDLPLLVELRNIATRHLHSLAGSDTDSPATTPTVESHLKLDRSKFCIGFITPPFKDPKIPVSDHLHAHAYIEPADLASWWRGISYGSLAWFDIDDLIAEIRESVSNNRVKSGYQHRKEAPIDSVPSAGARSGHSNGLETSLPSIGRPDVDLESGEASLLASITMPVSSTPMPAIRL